MQQPFDDMESHNRIPRGFLILLFGLIAWGIAYISLYTPRISGWSQYERLRKETADGEHLAAAAPRLHENPYERDAKAVAEGQVLYDESCAGCHGKALAGDVGPSLADHLKYGENDPDLYESIEKGRPDGMPAFGAQLGRERIWKVVAYIDSIRERPGTPPATPRPRR